MQDGLWGIDIGTQVGCAALLYTKTLSHNVNCMLQDALAYIENHMPVSKKLVVVCNDEWKEFLARPSLKYILRLLTGIEFAIGLDWF